MRYQFIQDHQGTWSIDSMCSALDVSRSGFYAWLHRPQSPRAKRRAELLEVIEEVHHESRGTYGSPRVHAELLDRDQRCNVKTVAKIMKDANIAAKTKRKLGPTTNSNHDRPVAQNVLDRNFDVGSVGEVWASDITYIRTGEGWLYLAVVEDIGTRRIVGWSMDSSMQSRLVVDALEMALTKTPRPESLLFHSDRGSQYASTHVQRWLTQKVSR